MTTNTTRNSKTTARNLTALRAELTQLTAMVELHTECLQTTAEAIKTLQDKILKASAGESPKETAREKPKAKKAPASKKQPTKKASAPTEQGRPWSKLSKDEKSRCNKAVWANPRAHGFNDWSDWTEKRTTLMFR